jgi:hypothetical protein
MNCRRVLGGNPHEMAVIVGWFSDQSQKLTSSGSGAWPERLDAGMQNAKRQANDAKQAAIALMCICIEDIRTS